MRYWFYYSTQLIFHFHLIILVSWKCFVLQLYPFRKGILGGLLNIFTWIIGSGEERARAVLASCSALVTSLANPWSRSHFRSLSVFLSWVANTRLKQLASRSQKISEHSMRLDTGCVACSPKSLLGGSRQLSQHKGRAKWDWILGRIDWVIRTEIEKLEEKSIDLISKIGRTSYRKIAGL